MKNARQVAVEALMRVETADSYSNIVLDRLLKYSGLDARDKAFASALFYGVLEKKLSLDYSLSRYVSMPFDKTDPLIRQILRVGAYQIAFLDGVTNAAAVHQSVELAKIMGKTKAAGFVNGVLRSFLRAGGSIHLPDRDNDGIRWLSLKYSIPEPLIRMWQNQYPDEDIQVLLEGFDGPAPIFGRVNTTKTNRFDLCKRLEMYGVKAEPFLKLDDCILLFHVGNLEKLDAFQEGLFHIQDLSSQLCALALVPEKGMRVLDCCAAPGGKSFTIAQCMEDAGEVVAGDLYQKRVQLISQGAKRLGLSSVKAVRQDASVFSPDLGLFDRVLCDAPCSGLGVIRRKPEIRYKSLESLEKLPQIQYKILETASKYVKEGGLLLYSTCTLNRRENEDVVQRFLKEHPHFAPQVLPAPVLSFLEEEGLSSATLMPHRHRSDGFFFALFSRKVL